MYVQGLSGHCCGLFELADIQHETKNFTKAIVDACDNDSRNDSEESRSRFRGQLIFTQASRTKAAKSYGWALKKFLEENDLGIVTVGAKPMKNANTGGNYITIFIWAPNVKKLQAFVKAYRKDHPKPAPVRSAYGYYFP
jgi:hypothetical protein